MGFVAEKTNGTETGFSLIELAIVISIIALLGWFAFPRFQTFQAKARQAEAKTMLNTIYTLEESYHSENNQYVALPPIGFDPATGKWNCDFTGAAAQLGLVIAPCSESHKLPRYQYTVTLPVEGGFIATATSGVSTKNLVVPNCKVADVWTIDQNRELKQAVSAIKACD